MPMPFKEITKITLEAAQAIELDIGVLLPPGSYQGARMRTRDDLPGDVIWTPTRYRIELTAEQIASMGAKVQPNQSFEEIDVTKFVRIGQLIIR
jgi:hypothetical protein